jgi:NADH-quinone oxidoreductase subunit K
LAFQQFYLSLALWSPGPAERHLGVMSVELMLNAANLAFVAFARYHEAVQGQIFVFFVMAVAAAEVAVWPGFDRCHFNSRHSISVDEINTLKG